MGIDEKIKHFVCNINVRFKSFNLNYDDLFEILSIYLENNIELGVVTTGLSKLVFNLKSHGDEEVAVSAFTGPDKIFLVYSDTSYTVILGIVEGIDHPPTHRSL